MVVASSRRRMVISAITIIAGIILIAISLLFYQDGGGHQTSIGGTIVYGVENMILGMAGAFLVGTGVVYSLGGEEHSKAGTPIRRAGDAAGTEAAAIRSEDSGGPLEGAVQTRGIDDTALVLRLLEGDERRMFLAIRDAGGEALQKDLIENTKMSNAKVTRVLDKLEERGLIVKERHGMTNKVRIEIDR